MRSGLASAGGLTPVTTTMRHVNLSAVMSNAAAAEVEVLVVAWVVFQDTSMHELLRRLAPAGTHSWPVQLRLPEASWRERFTTRLRLTFSLSRAVERLAARTGWGRSPGLAL